MSIVYYCRYIIVIQVKKLKTTKYIIKQVAEVVSYLNDYAVPKTMTQSQK